MKVPRWILEAEEPSGHVQWALPPDSGGGQMMCVGLRDWFDRPDLWNKRAIAKIPGTGSDTTFMLRGNFRGNIDCSPMAGDCEHCKEYSVGKCHFIAKTGQPCPKGHTQNTKPCLECDQFNDRGYLCMKWVREGNDWKSLWGKESGKTIIICGPGPNLLKYKDEIEEYRQDRDNFRVMSISRAIYAIPSDYYVSIERRKPADWDPSKLKYPQTTFIGSTISDWRMVRAFRHRYFGETFNAVTEKGNFLDSGKERCSISLGNISPDAMMVAAKLGAKEIWLYGYEFSCTLKQDEKGESSVDHYYFDMPIDDPHMKFYGVTGGKYFPMKGIDGKKCVTSYELMSVGAYCQAQAEMLEKYHGIKVVNKGRHGTFYLGVDEL